MKTWKTEIINAIVEEAKTDRIISLYEVSNRLGHNHVPQHDCLDICNAVLKALPNYRFVKLCTWQQMNNKATASLFTTGTFVKSEVEFEDYAE